MIRSGLLHGVSGMVVATLVLLLVDLDAEIDGAGSWLVIVAAVAPATFATVGYLIRRGGWGRFVVGAVGVSLGYSLVIGVALEVSGESDAAPAATFMSAFAVLFGLGVLVPVVLGVAALAWRDVVSSWRGAR